MRRVAPFHARHGRNYVLAQEEREQLGSPMACVGKLFLEWSYLSKTPPQSHLYLNSSLRRGCLSLGRWGGPQKQARFSLGFGSLHDLMASRMKSAPPTPSVLGGAPFVSPSNPPLEKRRTKNGRSEALEASGSPPSPGIQRETNRENRFVLLGVT